MLRINRKNFWQGSDSNPEPTAWETCPKPTAVIYFWIKRVGSFALKKRKTTLLNEKIFLHITYAAKNKNQQTWIRPCRTKTSGLWQRKTRWILVQSSLITFRGTFWLFRLRCNQRNIQSFSNRLLQMVGRRLKRWWKHSVRYIWRYVSVDISKKPSSVLLEKRSTEMGENYHQVQWLANCAFQKSNTWREIYKKSTGEPSTNVKKLIEKSWGIPLLGFELDYPN